MLDEHLPALSNLVRFSYAKPSVCLFAEPDGPAEAIESTVGSRQGCGRLGSLTYCLALQPAVQQLQTEFPDANPHVRRRSSHRGRAEARGCLVFNVRTRSTPMDGGHAAQRQVHSAVGHQLETRVRPHCENRDSTVPHSVHGRVPRPPSRRGVSPVPKLSSSRRHPDRTRSHIRRCNLRCTRAHSEERI